MPSSHVKYRNMFVHCLIGTKTVCSWKEEKRFKKLNLPFLYYKRNALFSLSLAVGKNAEPKR